LRIDDHLAGEPLAVLVDELLEGVQPDGEHEHVGPLDRLADAHHLRVAVEVGRELSGGLLVAACQEEVLTAGREVRREPAADVAGADDGHRGIRNSHSGSPFPHVSSPQEAGLRGLPFAVLRPAR
jgi:hypothetical protein